MSHDATMRTILFHTQEVGLSGDTDMHAGGKRRVGIMTKSYMEGGVWTHSIDLHEIGVACHYFYQEGKAPGAAALLASATMRTLF